MIRPRGSGALRFDGGQIATARPSSTAGRRAWRLVCAAALVVYGSRAGAVPPGLKAGAYRAVLETPGGELPFGLDFERHGDRWIGHLINGRERLLIDEVAVRGNHLEIKMPGYANRVTAAIDGNRLHGELVLDKLHGNDQHIPLEAELGRTYRFFAHDTTDRLSRRHDDVAGRWAVTFTEEDGKTEAAVAEFSQVGDSVTGTFLTDTGDHRFLAGEVRGGELYLSTFDGAHVFLYKAKIAAADGALAGDFWSGTAYHETWTARRDASAALRNEYSLTTMRDGLTDFKFAFPDLVGNTVTSTDARFHGKVLIVALAGSWCPNCHDEAAFLAPVYREYRGRGLEVVSLMFEHFGDFEQAAAATLRFRRHYDIDYTTLIAGISDKDDAAKKLPMLDRVYAFPTMIFIDRSGKVRKIHTGYSGPATGEHYTQFVREFKSTLEQLLAES